MTQVSEVYTLGDAAADTRALADRLFKGPCSNIKPGSRGEDRCFFQEEHRPITAQEKANGFECRPFWAFNPQAMCANCRIFWYAELAAQEAHRHACLIGPETLWTAK